MEHTTNFMADTAKQMAGQAQTFFKATADATNLMADNAQQMVGNYFEVARSLTGNAYGLGGSIGATASGSGCKSKTGKCGGKGKKNNLASAMDVLSEEQRYDFAEAGGRKKRKRRTQRTKSFDMSANGYFDAQNSANTFGHQNPNALMGQFSSAQRKSEKKKSNKRSQLNQYDHRFGGSASFTAYSSVFVSSPGHVHIFLNNSIQPKLILFPVTAQKHIYRRYIAGLFFRHNHKRPRTSTSKRHHASIFNWRSTTQG